MASRSESTKDIFSPEHKSSMSMIVIIAIVVVGSVSIYFFLQDPKPVNNSTMVNPVSDTLVTVADTQETVSSEDSNLSKVQTPPPKQKAEPKTPNKPVKQNHYENNSTVSGNQINIQDADLKGATIIGSSTIIGDTSKRK